jgi:hypothetical protein
VTTLAHAADNSPQLRDRLKAAAALSSLDDPTLKPWHWQLDVTLFDNDGKNPSTGALEIWSSGDNMLMRYSLRSEQMTVLRVGEKLYRTPGNLKQLANAVFLQLQLIHPIPDQTFAATVTEKFTTEKIGKANVDSIAPILVKPTNESVLIGRPFSLFLEPGSPRLLITYEEGAIQILRKIVGLFQSHEVATDLAVYMDRVLTEEAKTVKLQELSPDPALFQITPEMMPFTVPAEVPSGDISRMMLSQTPPSYPAEAKARRAQGKLVFDAIIGTDGHIESLQPAANADPSLIKEADRVIRMWIYRPFLVNGIPVEVKTQIHMNFTFG